jgi:hypothetical protein
MRLREVPEDDERDQAEYEPERREVIPDEVSDSLP